MILCNNNCSPSISFFDVEKPKKSKKTTKITKLLLSGCYKFSIIGLIFFTLVLIVLFAVAFDNSTSQNGFFTSGSPTTIIWMSIVHAGLCITILFDLFVPLLVLRLYKRIMKCLWRNTKDEKQLNIDGYFMSLVIRVLWSLMIAVVGFINWICYGLYYESRDRIAGYISFFTILTPISYISMAYHQYVRFRKHNILIFGFKDSIDNFYVDRMHKRTRLCCRFGFLLKLVCYLIMTAIFATLILITIQAVSIAQDELKYPGKLVTVTSNKQPFDLHLYCEGREDRDDVVLMDADVGVASPYAYYKQFLSLLANSGMRACVIERAGYGFSDSGPFPRDLGNNTALEMASIIKSSLNTPIVLVSHSAASFTARVMMHYYPKLLRGVVLIHPAHENQDELYFKGQVYNMSNDEFDQLKQKKLISNNWIRFVTPLALTRLFPQYFHANFILTQDDIFELYYLNGWKTYFSISNMSLIYQYTQHTIHLNKYSNVVWSELNSFSSISHMMNDLRGGNSSLFHFNSSRPFSMSILTSQHVLNGTCEDNHLDPSSRLCQNFLAYQSKRQDAILSMHFDLANYYRNYLFEWSLIPGNFDVILTNPSLVVQHVIKLMVHTKP